MKYIIKVIILLMFLCCATMSVAEPSIDYKKRINDAKRIVKNNPNNFYAWLQLGNDYFDTERPKLAIEAYSKALKLKPNTVPIMNDIAVMHRKLGNYHDAIKYFKKSLTIEPENVQALYNLGIVYFIDLIEKETGISYWRKYINIYINDPSQSQNIAEIEKYMPEENIYSSSTITSPPLNNISVDTNPPSITIISPNLQRSLKIIDKSNILSVTGIVRDVSGVSDVKVNGIQALLDDQGNFSAEILLKFGENLIHVTAVDTKGNQSFKNITVNRR